MSYAVFICKKDKWVPPGTLSASLFLLTCIYSMTHASSPILGRSFFIIWASALLLYFNCCQLIKADKIDILLKSIPCFLCLNFLFALFLELSATGDNFYTQNFAAAFFNKNYLSEALVIGLPISLYFTQESKKLKERCLWLAMTTCLTVHVAISHSKAGILSLCIILLVFTLYSKKKNKFKGKYLRYINTCIIVCLILGYMSHYKYDSIHHISRTLEGRISIWYSSLLMLKDHLWTGVGFQQFVHLYSEYEVQSGLRQLTNLLNTNEHAHNDLLNLLCEMGLLYSTILFIAVYKLIKSFFQSYISATSKQQNLLFKTVFLPFIAILIQAQFNRPFYWSYSPYILAFLAAISFIIKIENSNKPTQNTVKPKAISLSLILLSPLSLFALYSQTLDTQSKYHGQRAKEAFLKKDYSKSILAADKALTLNPLNYHCLSTKALAHEQINESNKAIKLHERKLNFYPNNTFSHYKLAELEARRGNPRKAARHLEFIKKQIPTSPQTEKLEEQINSMTY